MLRHVKKALKGQSQLTASGVNGNMNHAVSHVVKVPRKGYAESWCRLQMEVSNALGPPSKLKCAAKVAVAHYLRWTANGENGNMNHVVSHAGKVLRQVYAESLFRNQTVEDLAPGHLSRLKHAAEH